MVVKVWCKIVLYSLNPRLPGPRLRLEGLLTDTHAERARLIWLFQTYEGPIAKRIGDIKARAAAAVAQAAEREEAARKAAIKAGVAPMAAPPPGTAEDETKGEGGDEKKTDGAVVVTARDVLYVESDVTAAELCEQGLEKLRAEMRSILDDEKILSKRDRWGGRPY